LKLEHLLLAGCLVATVCTPAAADPVTYQYSGEVDSDDAARGWVSFSGLFTFESLALDGIADPTTGAYASAGAPYGMSVMFNDGTVDSLASSFDVLISNNLGGWDWFGVLAQNGNASRSLGLTLIDYTAGLFASDGLPLPAGGLTLANFGSTIFTYESGGGLLQGHLDAFSCSSGCNIGTVVPAVPEPETWLLMLAGLLGATVQLQRRRGPAAR
jgi:hypothetical protein